MLRRQSRDTDRNIKRLVYCQYRQYSLTFRALALRQRETEKNNFYFSLTKGQRLKRQTIHAPYWQYTYNLFIFRFVEIKAYLQRHTLTQSPESTMHVNKNGGKLTFFKRVVVHVSPRYLRSPRPLTCVYACVIIIFTKQHGGTWIKSTT